MTQPIESITLSEVHASSCTRFRSLVRSSGIIALCATRTNNECFTDWIIFNNGDNDVPQCDCTHEVICVANEYYRLRRPASRPSGAIIYIYRKPTSGIPTVIEFEGFTPLTSDFPFGVSSTTTHSGRTRFASRGTNTASIRCKRASSAYTARLTLPRRAKNARRSRSASPRLRNEQTTCTAHTDVYAQPRIRHSALRKRDPTHYGDHSVVPINVIDYDCNTIASEAMNVWSRVQRVHRARPEITIYDEVEQDVILTGYVTLPAHGPNAVVHESVIHVHRTLGLNQPPLLPTTFTFSPPIKIGEMLITDAAAMLTMNVFQARAIANTLRAQYSFSRGVAEGIAASFDQSLMYSDLSGLFTLIAIIEDTYFVAESMGIALATNLRPQDSIIGANVNADGPDVPGALAVLHGAIRDNLISFHAPQLTPEDYSLLSLLCTGIQGIIPPVDPPDTIKTLSFVFPLLRFFIWDTQPPNIPGENVPLTSNSIAASAMRFVQLLSAEDDYVCGYTRATLYTNNIHVEEVRGGAPVDEESDEEEPDPAQAARLPGPAGDLIPIIPGLGGGARRRGDANRRRERRAPERRNIRLLFFNLETQLVEIPMPTGANFLWKVCNVSKRESLRSKYHTDYVALTSLPSQHRTSYGTVVAALFHVGLCTVLNEYNFSGKEIMVLANRGPMPGEADIMYSRVQLEALFCQARNDVIHIYSAAAACVGQFSDITISPECFRGRSWCAHRNFVPPLIAQGAWRVDHLHSVPYFVHFWHVSAFIAKFISCWGVSAPGVSFDLSSDVIRVGLDSGWAPALGESKYEATALSPVPSKNVPYGLLSINCVAQHFRLDGLPPIMYQQVNVGAKRTRVGPNAFGGPAWQPAYNHDIFTAAPGSILTYDWSIGKQIQPWMPLGDIAADLWVQLSRSTLIKSEWAGLQLDAPIGDYMPPPINALIAGLFIGGPAPIEPAQPAEQNLN